MTIEETAQKQKQPNPSEFKSALIGVIETALNETIQMDAQASTKLAKLTGKVIAIELKDWNFTFYLLPDAQGIQVMSEYMGDIDTTISGTPVALFNMSKGDASAATMREQNISIEGDLELGQQFSQFFKELDIDWQEKIAQSFSKITTESNADVIAHKVGRLVESFQNWKPQAQQTLEKNIAEYFQQESQILPFAEEMEPFNSAVDTLRNDVDRLEARIQRIANLKDAEKNAKDV